ncbi:TetR/AcrR family transcriptional regulator [Actinoplanes sp. NPDC051494]|uniref:TetR/AcrR family transcriptional regulator n=1 Tax=Actinoplanes sp. NPDC051494 TaxID=3363907 RepID=UPI0037B2E760
MTERLTRAEQQARTREKLLDSAETLFGEQGIHQTSLDQIAAAAGLTKGAIYANFGGKKELITAIAERKLAEDVPVRPRESLESWIGALGGDFETSMPKPEIRRFALAFVELWLNGMRDEGSTETVRQWLRRVRELHARDAEALGVHDPQRTAALLLALDVGIGLQSFIDPEAVPPEFYTRGIEAVLRATPPE